MVGLASTHWLRSHNLASVYTKWGQSSVTCPQRAHPCSSITQSQIYESYVMIIGLSSYCREALGDRDALESSSLSYSWLQLGQMEGKSFSHLYFGGHGSVI